MGQSAAICCSNREKYDQSGFSGMERQFDCIEVPLQIESPHFLAFAPLWQRDILLPRRLAVSAASEVHVYRLPEVEIGEIGSSPDGVSTPRDVFMEHRFAAGDGMEVTCMNFTDELSSRSLAIATASSGSQSSHSSHSSRIRIYDCDAVMKGAQGETFLNGGNGSFRPSNWTPDACLHSLEAHGDRVTHMAVSQSYLISADLSGACCVWHKSKGFLNKQTSRIHQSSVADLAVDRFFVYSVGSDDRSVSIWSLPALMQIAVISIEIPKELFLGMKCSNLPVPVAAYPIAEDEVPDSAVPSSAASLLSSGTLKDRSASDAFSLSKITVMRRPLSRWAGSQGSSRNPKQAPKGMLYIAGVLAETCEVAGAGAGILMEWSLTSSDTIAAHCQSVQVAHDVPIVSIGYGPYDNGPIITADARGVFRVWDTVPRLTCSQHIEFFCGPNSQLRVSMAMEPRRGFFSCMGDNRLFVWRRAYMHRALF